jgi:SAM-dependent methyltransferase
MDPKIHIDKPAEDTIDQPYFELRGWLVADKPPPVLKLRVNGEQVPLSLYERPGVTRAHPRSYATGFSRFLRLWDFRSDRAELDFLLDERPFLSRRLQFTAQAREKANQHQRDQQGKRQWLRSRLQCPKCRSALPSTGKTARCPHCAAGYSLGSSPLNLLAPDMPPAEIDFRGEICSHGYNPDVRKLIASVRETGGKVLDCGAGLRPEEQLSDTVVTAEIFPYPSTDVLAANQSLPFADGIFDAVLSLHVLEHVSNPFLCAQELVRVLKPGGVVYAVTPMIVPEHGFPHHYFNPTAEGIATLFSGIAKVESVRVPFMGHPINGVRSVLYRYAHSLPPKQREKFLRMSVEQLLEGTVEEKIRSDIGTALSEEGRRRLAANFVVVARKEANGKLSGARAQ